MASPSPRLTTPESDRLKIARFSPDSCPTPNFRAFRELREKSISGFHAPDWVASVDPEEYQEIRDLSLKIFTHFPPDKHQFIGVGRSPTPILAFLQACPGVLAMNLPLSQFRFAKYAVPSQENQNGSTYARPNHARSDLDQHFDRFLLWKIRSGPEKWVLIDFSQKGHTLASLFPRLESYLRRRSVCSRKQLPKLHLLALADPRGDGEEIRRNLENYSHTTFSLEKYPRLASGLCWQKFDAASEYGMFVLGRDEPDWVLRRAIYRKLKRTMAVEIARDWEWNTRWEKAATGSKD
ncbi:MAG: hypothetical protein P4M08_02645 [Oligoflexia bacterium]|nr:hypothetical protein [Oligoflexia bacterium]